MLAINHPNVVLGASETKFLAPVRVGECLRAIAREATPEGKKRLVDVEVMRDDTLVMQGRFVCFTPSRHVLAQKDAP